MDARYIAIRFGTRIKVNRPILPILTLKLIAMACTLSHREKGAKSAIYDQIPTIWWNFGENRSSRSWVLFAQKFILKKKLTQAEHIAREACMPRGLKRLKTW